MADVPGRDDLERRLARLLSRFLSAYGGRLLEKLGEPPNLSNIPFDFWDNEGKELAKILGPFGQDIFLEMAQDLMASQPVGVEWALVNEAAIRWIKDYSFDMVGKINEHTRSALDRALTNYFEQGQTIGELQQSVSPLFGPTRAEAIAVTEISRAANWGEFATVGELRKEGINLIANWETSDDEVVCPICRPLDGRKADSYDADGHPTWVHPNSGKEYSLDPAHPRCRCWRNWTIAGLS